MAELVRTASQARRLDTRELREEYPREDDEILTTARSRFAAIQEAESRQRERERREQRFASGKQWEEQLENERRIDRRPSLTMNRTAQFVNQVVNEQIVSPVAMRVQPVDDYADVETAKIIYGIFRNIEVTSQADVAYGTAYHAACEHGVGYFRVLTEYESPTSFKQVVRIRRIRNRFAAYLDHTHHELDGSDANWGFIVERLSRSAYCQRYRMHSSVLDTWTGTGDTWITPQEVQVAEYFYREWVHEELVLLADGETRLARETTPTDMIVARRPTLLPVVWWVKINGYQVLERSQWLGSTIPLIPMYGMERDLDGEIERTGMVSGLMDPQMLYNYMASSEAEAIGLAPRAPFVIAEGQLEGYENYWDTANTRNWAFLPYKPTTSGGVPVAPPQRLAVEPAVQAISQSRLFAVEDMKASVGLYDASLGARSNETSGVAIRARASEGNLATAHYPFHKRVAIRRCATVCLELIPLVYDQAQVTRIIGEDDEPELVPINQRFTKQGKEQMYDVTVGKYDVVPSSGPSFSTKREEAADRIDGLVRAYPPVMAVAGDYLVRNLDMPYSQEIAARLKTQVPPAALAATESGAPEDQVAGLKNQVAQLGEQLKALNSYAQQSEQHGQEARQRIGELELQQEALKVRLAGKDDELRLKGRELDLKAREIDLEEQRMHLDHQIALAKVGVDEQKVARNGQGSGQEETQ